MTADRAVRDPGHLRPGHLSGGLRATRPDGADRKGYL